MSTIVIGGHLLGEIYVDRSGTDPKLLSMSLDSAERRIRTLPVSAGSALPPLLEDLGADLSELTLETQRDFDSESEAELWVWELATERGYAGLVEATVADGRTVSFPYGVATPRGTTQAGAMIRVRWSLRLGRKGGCS